MSNSNPVGPLVFLGDPNVGNTLVGRPNAIEDADGINYSTARFQWLRNGEPIPGATGQKYVLTAADLNAQISLTYSYLDYGGTQETVVSKSKVVLAEQQSSGSYTPPTVTAIEPIPTPNNSAPEGPLTILGDALVGNSLVARPNAIKDADGINSSTAKFYWLRDGELIQGANSQTYVVTDADRGAQISVLYSYYDNGGSFEVVASKPEPAVPGGVAPTTPVVDDTPPPPPAPEPAEDDGAGDDPDFFAPTGDGINNPAIGKLIIYGFPVLGATLEARNDAVFDREGFDRDKGFYRWLRDGEPIPGATKDAYTVTEDDLGTSISLEYTFLDFSGNVEKMVSPAEPPVPYPDGMEPEDNGVTSPQPRAADGISDAATTPEDDIVVITAEMAWVDGLEGVDTAVLAGDQSDYTVEFGPDGVTVTDRSAGGIGPVELENFEFLDFDTELPVFNGPMNLQQFGGHTSLGQADFEAFVEMYIAYFNRAPDAIGLSFWGTAFANGTSMEDIASMFADQPETLATYPADLSNIKFAADVYQNVLGRAPDIEGLRFWTNALDDGAVSRGEFILEVLRGVKAAPPADASQDFIDRQLADQAYLESKTDLGALFAVHRGMSNVDDATMVMELFDGSADSLDTAVEAVNTLYEAAQSSVNGDFLMPLVGVLDDPFAI